jgi:hypothetical protein
MMAQRNAFPIVIGEDADVLDGGMSLKEYLIAAALPAAAIRGANTRSLDPKEIAERAIQIAEAVMAQGYFK